MANEERGRGTLRDLFERVFMILEGCSVTLPSPSPATPMTPRCGPP